MERKYFLPETVVSTEPEIAKTRKVKKKIVGKADSRIKAKKIVSALMIIFILAAGLMPVTCSVLPAVAIYAASGYDRDAALKYAAAHWNVDKEEKCAEFVSNCIHAGGVSKSTAWSRGCTSLRRQLLASGMGSEYEIKLKSDMSIKASDYSGILEPGDLIFYYCPTCTDGNFIHAVLYAGMDKNGYAKCYSHNNANNASKRYYYSSRCYSCRTKLKKAYVFHFNTDKENLKEVSVEEGWYVLGSACGKDGLSVLDICNNSMDDGGNAIIYPWHQAMNQVFYIKPVGDEGYYSIMAMHSGKYLHVKDGSTSIVNVHQWSCCDHTNSHWRIYDAGDGFCYIQNRSTGSFLDLNGADITPTNNVGCYDFNKSNAQKWRLNICQVN